MSENTMTVVVEDGLIRPRLRRPSDLLRALLGALLAAAVLGLALVASETLDRLDGRLDSLAEAIPSVIRTILTFGAGVGVLAIPVVASIDLLLRRRGRQLLDALLGLFLAVIALVVMAALIKAFGSQRLIDGMNGANPTATSVPTDPILGGLVAFITVARLLSRPRWAIVCLSILVALLTSGLLAGFTSSAGLAESMLVGWTVGLLTRWAVGTPTTRPPGTEVAAALGRAGRPVSVLRAVSGVTGGRAYTAVSNGDPVDVVVLDRDLDGQGLIPAAWRSLRLRDDATLGGRFSMRQLLERTALMGYAAQAAGVPSPRLLAVTDVGPDSAVMAFDRIPGDHASPRIASPAKSAGEPPILQGQQLTRHQLTASWTALSKLQQSRLAHGNLSLRNLLLGHDGVTYIENLETGNVAASDLLLRIDVATMLASLTMASDARSAIETGVEVLGREEIFRALPVLQPVAMPGEVRTQLKHRKDVLPGLRKAVAELDPVAEMDQIQIERIRPRTVVLALIGSIAAYVLVGQIGNIDLGQIISDANPAWIVALLILSFLTYVGAAMTLQGFTPEPMSRLRTLLTQFAASFTTLVAPPTVGTVAINVRYLQKAGLPSALAAATVAVSQVAAFVVHILMLLIVGVVAGSSQNFSFTPPTAVVVAAVAIGIALVLLASQPRVRAWLSRRIGPTMAQVGPRMATLIQQPSKLLVGFGGILLLNVAYCIALVCAVRAFSPELSPAAIAFVYLAGSTIGSAAPTPGGLGAVEAALSAGLTAAGLPGAVAVSAVLLFRLCTFWLPTIPGWFSFRWLSSRDAL